MGDSSICACFFCECWHYFLAVCCRCVVWVVTFAGRGALLAFALYGIVGFFSDTKYGIYNIAGIVEPDIVESVLDTFSFDVDQRKRVINAIRERRIYEANQPVPPPSDW